MRLMGIFGNSKKLSERVDRIESAVRESFRRVREDLGSSGAWIIYLNEREDSYENQLRGFEGRITKNDGEILILRQRQTEEADLLKDLMLTSQKMAEQLSVLGDYAGAAVSQQDLNFHIEKISAQIGKVEVRIEEFSYLKSQVEGMKSQLSKYAAHDPTEIEKRVDALQAKLMEIRVKKSPRDNLVEKVARNSHDYVKAVVQSYVRKYGEISGYQLREMIVEEQNLTSKSTFYRILEGIEQMEDITTIRKGKDKIYLSKASRIA